MKDSSPSSVSKAYFSRVVLRITACAFTWGASDERQLPAEVFRLAQAPQLIAVQVALDVIRNRYLSLAPFPVAGVIDRHANIPTLSHFKSSRVCRYGWDRASVICPEEIALQPAVACRWPPGAWLLLTTAVGHMVGHMVGLRFHQRLVSNDSARVKRVLGVGLLAVSLAGLAQTLLG